MVNIVIQLHLYLILQLSILIHELLLINILHEVLIVLRNQVRLTDVCPRIESVSHGVLCPQSQVLASSEQEDFMDLLIKMLPVEGMRDPEEGIGSV